jgi:ATP-binding cassette subfamily F protein 3
MIQLDNVTLSYAGVPLLEDLSFVVNRGEKCGLVGRNGSGKSTLFRLLMGYELPDRGNISISKGYTLGMLDQHIKLNAPTVIEEACLGLPVGERDEVYRAEKMLFGLGFTDDYFEKLPKDLSGGYQLRLHLAKVLLSEPNCLLLDEPTNYLDILSMRFMAKLLARFDGEIIIISHDREFMDSFTTHTLGVHRKKIKKVTGSSVDYFNQIVLEEEIQEKTRMNVEKKKAHLQSFVDRFGAKATKAGQAQSRKKALEKIPSLEALKELYNLNFSFRMKPFPGKKVGGAENVVFGYPGKETLIHDFSLEVEPGDRIAIIGKNGYGKSTILRMLAKDLAPNEGNITYADQVAIGYFGQTNIDRLAPNHTIEEEIKSANPQLNYTDVKAICGQMMFSGTTASKKIQVLSGGERSRVLLGKILAHPCNFLLLDEPTHHLDIESVEALIDALEEFPGVVIFVTHSELILKRLALDKLVVCHQYHQEVFCSDYEEFLEKIGWEEEKPLQKKAKQEKPKKELIKDTSSSGKEKRALEGELKKLKEAQEADYTALANASQKGDRATIAALSKSIKAREKEIEELSSKIG